MCISTETPVKSGKPGVGSPTMERHKELQPEVKRIDSVWVPEYNNMFLGKD